MNQYQIRYNGTTNHIEGLEVRTTGSETAWSQSACGALTRGGLAVGKTYETAAEALRAAGNGRRKVCKNCAKAAELATETVTVSVEVPVQPETSTETVTVSDPLVPERGSWTITVPMVRSYSPVLRDRWGNLS